MDDIFVYFVDLPNNINEMVTPCADGYTVYINARIGRENALRAFEHAVGHILHNDFEKANVGEIEAIAHEARR